VTKRARLVPLAGLFASKLHRQEKSMALYYLINPWLVPPLVVPMLLVILIAATRLIQ
jgi:hypothetical protein